MNELLLDVLPILLIQIAFVSLVALVDASQGAGVLLGVLKKLVRTYGPFSLVGRMDDLG